MSRSKLWPAERAAKIEKAVLFCHECGAMPGALCTAQGGSERPTFHQGRLARLPQSSRKSYAELSAHRKLLEAESIDAARDGDEPDAEAQPRRPWWSRTKNPASSDAELLLIDEELDRMERAATKGLRDGRRLKGLNAR